MNQEIKAKWVAALRSGEYRDVLGGLIEERDLTRWSNRVVSATGCWTWSGAHNSDAYPCTNLRSKLLRVNRLMWVLTHGRDIPSGYLICHGCDNTRCVRPDHLWLGTLTDNNRDRSAKGRSRDQTGERNNQAKLTDAQRAEVRELYKAGVFQKVIGARFGLSQTGVSKIVRILSATQNIGNL